MTKEERIDLIQREYMNRQMNAHHDFGYNTHSPWRGKSSYSDRQSYLNEWSAHYMEVIRPLATRIVELEDRIQALENTTPE